MYSRRDIYGISNPTEQKESENKTICFPLPLIERINQALIGTEVSFSSFVIQASEFALDNLEDSEHENTEKTQ
ncbi:MAG: hypothetical protein MR763_07855 [Clostridiales bacterium]|nr:hypothetical protein [Clostridiales bacterium]